MGISSFYTGSHCPNCNSPDIHGDIIEPLGADRAFRKVNCSDCGAILEKQKTTYYSDME